MEVVQPIRSKRKVRQMFDWLHARNPRDALLWALGTHTGLRIGDLLSLQVRNVWFRGQAREHLLLRDQKTNKATRRLLVPFIQQLVGEICADLDPDRYLFVSRVGRNRPITRGRAYQILHQAARACRLAEVGTHTMRKTFGYHHYQAGGKIEDLQALFNHSSSRETLRYIGMTQDTMDKSMRKLDLMGE